MPELIHIKKPDWFKIKLPNGTKYNRIKNLIKTNRLNTICEEAKCPNLSECWSHGTATFLILGDVCARYCGYCNVRTGKPLGVDEEEPKKVAEAVSKLGLRYVVITSVTRDDLEDCGASIYIDAIKEIKKINKNCKIELLIPDLQLKNSILKIYNNDKNNTNKKNNFKINKNISNKININALKKIIGAKPDVLGHNIEAVRRVFEKVRRGGNYDLSLELLKTIKKINKNIKTKSGIMVGFGETLNEIIETMKDLRNNDVDFLTIGQYLQPSEKHVKIEKFYSPEEFEGLKKIGLGMGFKYIEAGPLVRSSYRADKLSTIIK